MGVVAAMFIIATPPRLSYAQTAPTEVEVAAARKLFADAAKDEEKGDLVEALEKFRRVQGVKDTPAVRFRIASCQEKLGRLGEAIQTYRSIATLAGAEPSQAEIVRASEDKARDVEKRLPALTLTLSAKAPPDAVVELDGKPVEAASLGRPVSVDVGKHRVAGHGTGATPFETEVTLPAGARFALTVPLDAAPKEVPPPVLPPPPPPSTTPVLGWALVGGGAAFIAAGGVTWLVRQSAIDTVKKDCPNNRCPESTRAEVTSAKSRAQTMVPLTIGLEVVGLAAVGTGIYFLTRPSAAEAPAAPAPPAARWSVTPLVGTTQRGLLLEGSF